MSSCPICTNTSAQKYWVSCCSQKCKFSCCRSCVEKYLLSQPDIQPKCMNCKTIWTSDFLASNLDEKFHNHVYRDYCATIIRDRERSLLPSTQPFVLQAIKTEETEDKIEELTQAIRELHSMINALKLKRNKLYDLQFGGILPVEEKKTNIRFVGHCPQKDCKGFLDEQYTCGICEEKACRSCRQTLHPDEECDKDTVATIKLLATDTKRCPNCGVPIYKISGCSQMFCLGCKTAFDWNTGKIETGRIHNPHYYELQRNLGLLRREEDDVRCGGAVGVRALVEREQELVRHKLDLGKFVFDLHKNIGDARQIIVPRYRPMADGFDTHRHLRVQYLRNKIIDSQWLSELKKHAKKREKQTAIHLVITMYVDVADDLLRALTTCEIKDVPVIKKQLHGLIKYANDEFAKISLRFQNKTPHVAITSGKLIDIGVRKSSRFDNGDDP